MQSDTFRTLAEYIHKLRCRDRDNYPAGEYPAFDTTVEDNAHWSQGHRSGNDGRGKNSPR